MSPPRLKKAETTQEAPEQQDLRAAKFSESTGPNLGKIAVGTVLAISAFTGTAAAQEPVLETVVEDPPCCEDKIDLSQDKDEPMKFGVSFDFVNDNMPGFITRNIGGPEHKTQDGNFFDDNGWTSELRLEANWQNQDTEYVLGGRLMMATDPVVTDFAGLRTDVGELVLQRNSRVELNDRTTLDYGFGGGVQAIGDLGGEGVQRWWHDAGVFGGRTGNALQGTQSSDSFRVMPLFTTGAELNYQLTDHFNLKTAGQALVPIGQGLGVVGLQAGLEANIGPFRAELGGKLDGSWSDADELDFMDVDGVRPGAYGSLELQTGKVGSVYSRIETGGFRNEPIMTVGFRIGLGSKSRLSPFR